MELKTEFIEFCNIMKIIDNVDSLFARVGGSKMRRRIFKARGEKQG